MMLKIWVCQELDEQIRILRSHPSEHFSFMVVSGSPRLGKINGRSHQLNSTQYLIFILLFIIFICQRLLIIIKINVRLEYKTIVKLFYYILMYFWLSVLISLCFFLIDIYFIIWCLFQIINVPLCSIYQTLFCTPSEDAKIVHTV